MNDFRDRFINGMVIFLDEEIIDAMVFFIKDENPTKEKVKLTVQDNLNEYDQYLERHDVEFLNAILFHVLENAHYTTSEELLEYTSHSLPGYTKREILRLVIKTIIDFCRSNLDIFLDASFNTYLFKAAQKRQQCWHIVSRLQF